MSKEQVGMIVMLLGLLGTVLTAGIRIGTLTERIEAQTKQIELLNQEVRGINAQFIAWVAGHR
jgi:hypothetical protein